MPRAPGVLKSCPSTLIRLGVLSGFFAKSYVVVFLVGLVLVSGEPRFYPSGCGGHKNLENAATFSKFLGQEEKPRLRAFFGDVLTLPVRLRPPEKGIVVVIGAFCRYWEGVFVSGGRKRRVLLQSGG